MRNLISPNTQVAGSLRRIAATSDGHILKEYLKANLDSTDEDNRILENVNLNRSQGKALTLKAILDLLEAGQQ